MKKIMLIWVGFLVVGFLAGGCAATDKAYEAGKTVYSVGKVAYDVSGVENEKLEKVHDVATKYDEAREIVRSGVFEKKLDANTSTALAK